MYIIPGNIKKIRRDIKWDIINMYKIACETKENKNTIIWDVENNKPLIKFRNGVAETDILEIAMKLKEKGYYVEGLEGNNTNIRNGEEKIGRKKRKNDDRADSK